MVSPALAYERKVTGFDTSWPVGIGEADEATVPLIHISGVWLREVLTGMR